MRLAEYREKTNTCAYLTTLELERKIGRVPKLRLDFVRALAAAAKNNAGVSYRPHVTRLQKMMQPPREFTGASRFSSEWRMTPPLPTRARAVPSARSGTCAAGCAGYEK